MFILCFLTIFALLLKNIYSCNSAIHPDYTCNNSLRIKRYALKKIMDQGKNLRLLVSSYLYFLALEGDGESNPVRQSLIPT